MSGGVSGLGGTKEKIAMFKAEDPREEILKYAKIAEEEPLFVTPVYNKNQPQVAAKTHLAKTVDPNEDEDADSPEKLCKADPRTMVGPVHRFCARFDKVTGWTEAQEDVLEQQPPVMMPRAMRRAARRAAFVAFAAMAAFVAMVAFVVGWSFSVLLGPD